MHGKPGSMPQLAQYHFTETDGATIKNINQNQEQNVY